MRIARLLPLLLLLVPLVAGAQSDSPADRFQGTWRVANVSSARQGRDRAVDRATDDMSIFVRGIARRRLRSGTPIHSTIQISGADASFRCKVGPYDLDFAADGRSHAFTDPFEDNEMQAKQRFRNGKLVQTMRGEDATLTHELSLSDDGETLTLKVKIESHHLPGDVVFRVRYRRS